MKTFTTTLKGNAFDSWLRIELPKVSVYANAVEPCLRDELVKLYDPEFNDGKPLLGRVRRVGSHSLSIEVYSESEPPYQSIAVDGEGWSYQRVTKAPGGSWLSHNSVNRGWVELENRVRVIVFGEKDLTID